MISFGLHVACLVSNSSKVPRRMQISGGDCPLSTAVVRRSCAKRYFKWNDVHLYRWCVGRMRPEWKWHNRAGRPRERERIVNAWYDNNLRFLPFFFCFGVLWWFDIRVSKSLNYYTFDYLNIRNECCAWKIYYIAIETAMLWMNEWVNVPHLWTHKTEWRRKEMRKKKWENMKEKYSNT